jgi:hypothetical protein
VVVLGFRSGLGRGYFLDFVAEQKQFFQFFQVGQVLYFLEVVVGEVEQFDVG